MKSQYLFDITLAAKTLSATSLPAIAKRVSIGLSIACCLFTSTTVTANTDIAATNTATDAIIIMLTSSQSQLQQLQLQYPAAVRLEQILTDSLANLSQLPVTSDLAEKQAGKPVYWTGAGAFTAFPHPEKAGILNQLNTLANQTDPIEREVLTNLKTTLAELAIGQRVFTPLDYDQVRINKADNPLVKQNLTLVLPSRPSSILVLGAVRKPQYLPWQARKSADDYLKQALPADMSDNSFATVIQPDGNVEQHPIAYWNSNHMDIAPGAIVYLGLSSLPSGYKDLNDAVINLLRNRAL